jgi:purine nucleosidase
MAVPVLLDCDPGHDDAMAILLAAASPAIDLLGITTVAGNQTLPKTTLNARRVCTVAGITSVPIAAGRDRPLHGPLRAAADIHGETGLDGPAFGERGNVTPLAEFNVYTDPEAADIVLGSGLPVTVCGLNVTHQALATRDVLDRMAALGTPLAGICVELLTFFAGSYRRVFGFDAPPLHDPVAVARVIDPAMVTTVEANVAVELTGTRTRGATVVDLHGVTGRQPNARVAVGLDAGRFWELVVAAVAALG